MGKHKVYVLKGVLICMLSLSLLGQGMTNPVEGRASLNKSVAGWLPYWDQARAFSVVQSNPDLFDELSPFWYDLGSSGELISLPNSEDSAVLNYAKTTQKKLIPLISNEFNSSLVSNVINNSSLKQKHISAIVNKVVSKGYNGIEIDYENVLTADKAAFTAFVQELAAALHTQGKTLIVTVQAKTKDSVTWNGPGATDYAAIGKAADKVRIMAYDYHWNTSSAGSIAPVSWVNQILAYAVAVIAPQKLVLGLPNYGYDWVGSQGKGITYNQALATSTAYGVPIIEDAQNGPHFSYNTNGVMHEIWFVNSDYYALLLDLVNRYNINGIAIWRLGGEDPNNYPVTRSKFGRASSPPPVRGNTTLPTPTTPNAAPTVTRVTTVSSAITAPSPVTPPQQTGSLGNPGQADSATTYADSTSPIVTLSTRACQSGIAFSASASDNVNLAKVEFFFDGQLVGTVANPSYTLFYSVERTAKYHTLRAIAYDARGNLASSEQTILY